MMNSKVDIVQLQPISLIVIDLNDLSLKNNESGNNNESCVGDCHSACHSGCHCHDDCMD